jgi:hypothetical protein
MLIIVIGYAERKLILIAITLLFCAKNSQGRMLSPHNIPRSHQSE